MTTLRPMAESDYSAVQDLHRAVGWPTRSKEGWRWLFANPARQETRAPAAWVLEKEDGSLCGHLGNLVQKFHCGDHTYFGATGFNIIVLPEARGGGQRLLRAFNAQEDMFAVWTFNANPVSSPLYARHGMLPWPTSTAGLKLGWVTRPTTLVAGRLLKALYQRAPQRVERLGEQLCTRQPRAEVRLALPEGVRWVTSLSDDSPYAWYWKALRAEGRMVSDRSPAIARWRLRDPDQTRSPVVLGVQRGGALVGCAVAQFAKGNAIEPVVLEIIDLDALDGYDEAIPQLMSALIHVARGHGAAKVRLQVVSPRLLTRLGRYGRRARPEGGWGHCHVRFLDEDVAESWSPTPWDGDYAFCLRPVPVMRG